MAAAAVLGVQPLRTTFLDLLRVRSRKQTRNTAARNTRRNRCGSNRAGAGGLRPDALTALLTAMALDHIFQTSDDDDLEDEDLDEDDEEVEDEEEDDEDEETWQVA